ncbi:S-adenosyl-L-methionine-dependent methyltransferase [Delitschia confertaspora ATCC 74209]|uniref:S-adenosyl-L-methionine-dependent methyltransferase n=1 Tax=Delitschia confertaspora ATCC 74209 TaxID=1513339 RepID=A0A9P4MX51_9PLEO|nr:S-adenosyl-L-methionine-dependent methyltransferase [Delitschia confertaspora ATCC 74209]
MERQPKSLPDAVQLLQTLDLISTSVKAVIAECEQKASARILPSQELFDAQRIVIAATGKLTELVSEPSARILEVATQFQESRAIYIAAERRIPDVLSKAGDGAMSVYDISKEVKIESRKLSRILRYLCTIGIFKETGRDVFSNNSISAALVSNEPLRAYVLLVNSEGFTASSETGPSYDVQKTAWQDAIGTNKTRWEWLEERVKPEKLQDSGGHYPGLPSLALETPPTGEDGLVARPELEIMGLSMVGGGRVFGTAHVYDYPWASLGDALIVDVGGGVGGFSLQLSKVYPTLTFIVQDRAPVVKQGQEKVWPKENPEALQAGRVEFVPHSFFDKNPTVGADIYYLRYVLHNWSDDYCVQILTRIRQSMEPHSRLLICDQVMNTTLGNTIQKPAPHPLPANYGYSMCFSHSRDITMMASINGIERTPEEFESILAASGLKIKQIWDCRSQVSLIEAVLA